MTRLLEILLWLAAVELLVLVPASLILMGSERDDAPERSGEDRT